MPSRIHLDSGDHVDVKAPPHEVLEALNAAPGKLVALESTRRDGQVLVNPDHVAYVTDKPAGRAASFS